MLKRLLIMALSLPFLRALTHAESCEDMFDDDNKSFVEMRFDDAELFIHIDKDDEDYELETCTEDENYPLGMSCHILLPDGEDRNVSENDCEGSFEYEAEHTAKVKLYVIVNGEYKTLEEDYDFDDGEWEGKGSSNSSNGDLDDFELDASDTTPNEDEWIDIEVEAIDSDNDTVEDYDWKIRFEVEVRDETYDEWEEADSDDYDLDRSYYNFDPDDDGIVIFDELLRITTDEGEYRLRVYDDYDENAEAYIEFDMDGGSSSSDGELDSFDFYYIEDTTPDREERITIKIQAEDRYGDLDDYEEYVTLKFEIEDGSSRDDADEYDLQIRSDDFNEDENDLDYNGEIEVEFINGRLEFEVYFEDDVEYKITVEDGSVDEYEIFDVEGYGSSDEDIDDFELKASDTTPPENYWIDIEISAIDRDAYRVSDYEGEVRFSVQVKDDNDRVAANSREYDLDETSYQFDSNDYGYIKLNNLISFDREGEYRLEVYDSEDEDISEYIEFDVDRDNENNEFDGFRLSADPRYPDANEWFDITVEAIDGDGDTYEEYEGTVRFRIEKRYGNYRSLARSDYYSLDRNEINFNSADDGEIEMDDFIKFREDWRYRVKVYDEDNSTKYDYMEFSINEGYNDDDSDIDGFSNKEYDQIKAVYNIRPSIIEQLLRDYRRLRYDNEWEDESDFLYENMEDVVEDKSDRIFDTYDDFFDAFLDRYALTISVR